jgi:micrococcal nuclease
MPATVRGSQRVAAGLALLVASALAAGCGGESQTSSTPTATPAKTQGSIAAVERVVDGDTFVVRTSRGFERVRLIGVDAPESVKPGAPVECFGPQASAELRRLLDGRTVRLETDVERRDAYGRLLAWVVRRPDGLLVNEALVRGGWAERFRRTPNVRYRDRLVTAERLARREGAGLWAACPAR